MKRPVTIHMQAFDVLRKRITIDDIVVASAPYKDVEALVMEAYRLENPSPERVAKALEALSGMPYDYSDHIGELFGKEMGLIWGFAGQLHTKTKVEYTEDRRGERIRRLMTKGK